MFCLIIERNTLIMTLTGTMFLMKLISQIREMWICIISIIEQIRILDGWELYHCNIRGPLIVGAALSAITFGCVFLYFEDSSGFEFLKFWIVLLFGRWEELEFIVIRVRVQVWNYLFFTHWSWGYFKINNWFLKKWIRTTNQCVIILCGTF